LFNVIPDTSSDIARRKGENLVINLSRRTVLTGGVALFASPAWAAKSYDIGASDTDIKIGNIMPYSGPASAYGIIGKTEAAYFTKINAEGGINGRKINFISYDDAYSPPKAVEQARRLVENDEVLLIFNPLGTPSNSAIQKYMNAKKVPQLFVASGAAKWNDPKHFPWTIGFGPSYQLEGHIYAQYLLQNHPEGRIGILYQNDDFGKDYVKGLKDGLAGKMPIVAEFPYEVQDTTVDSQILNLRAAGAGVFFDVATPKFTSQAIRKVAEIGWKPVHVMNSTSTSIGAVLKPAGLANSVGLISAAWIKDQTDPLWWNDPDYKEWDAFITQYFPDADRTNGYVASAYIFAQALVRVLHQCGDDLTRENVMRQAANLTELHFGMLLPGITANTGPDDFAPIKQMRMRRFTGEHWEMFGPVFSA
jgi:branched-chain amino acid transport system substrate-binding protein